MAVTPEERAQAIAKARKLAPIPTKEEARKGMRPQWNCNLCAVAGKDRAGFRSPSGLVDHLVDYHHVTAGELA